MRPLGTLTVLNSPASLQLLDVEMKSGFLRTISVDIWGTSFTDQDFRKVVEAFLESSVFVLNLENYQRSDKHAEMVKTIFGIWNTYPKTAVTTGKMVSLCTYAGISIDTDKFVEGENWVVEKEECGEETIIRIKDQDSAHSLKIFKEDLWLL
ncbi:hypothetical protein L596_028904 [Steinernema carpocapsae]|uniref:Uncharacterized protein n=1 Tax=Steinernema carpocapsae TaxID=34508 RepID=A0A4U5LZR4_STECR|nr:hypothetical protein L596_028904 [Steinernema carpocapsae]